MIFMFFCYLKETKWEQELLFLLSYLDISFYIYPFDLNCNVPGMCKILFTWPKTFVFERYYFHKRVCVCVCVCVCVSVYIDYLKKFLTDFDETWQDDV